LRGTSVRVAVTTIGGRLGSGAGSAPWEKLGNKIKNRRTQKKTIKPLLFPRKGNVETDGQVSWLERLVRVLACVSCSEIPSNEHDHE
jgi:hypothetical protein